MPKIEFSKISINQNIIFLLLLLVELGFAEYFKLKITFWILVVMVLWMSISVGLSMNWYTLHYIRKKSK